MQIAVPTMLLDEAITNHSLDVVSLSIQDTLKFGERLIGVDGDYVDLEKIEKGKRTRVRYRIWGAKTLRTGIDRARLLGKYSRYEFFLELE